MLSSSTLFQIRLVLIFFVTALVLSGLTAFPLLTELNLLCSWLRFDATVGPAGHSGLDFWLLTVREGLRETNTSYPFLAYGTDWLAFGHLVIALFFFGPWRDPVRNRWVIGIGMLACVLVLPLALIAGEIRGIPWLWRLIDCSFGIFGFFPLWWIWRKTKL